MTKSERGEKRRCLACTTAFFDLNRAPIVCPKCREIFHVVELVHSSPRRGGFPSGARWRSAPVETAAVVELNSETEVQDDDVDIAPAAIEPGETADETLEVELIEEIM